MLCHIFETLREQALAPVILVSLPHNPQVRPKLSSIPFLLDSG